MKTAFLLFSLIFSAHSAFADFSVGDHVLYPSLIRQPGGAESYSVGKIIEAKENGNFVVQDLNSPAKRDSNSADEYGQSRREVFITDLVKEVPSVNWNYSRTTIKQGSKVVAKIGHAAASLMVLFVFENGKAALVSATDYWDWLKANRNECGSCVNDDQLFKERPVLVLIK